MKTTQCSVEGCERGGKITRRMCQLHYARWQKNGTTDAQLRAIIPVAERLASKLERRPSGCLEWTGSTDRDGYGRIRLNGAMPKTHRIAWTLANGPIPDGLIVCHRCDNPPCCQTAPTEGYPQGHLFLGTDADNAHDRDAKGRGANGHVRKPYCKHGHEFTEANTIVKRNGARDCRACKRRRSAA